MNEDNYPLKAKVVLTFYGNPITHSYGGHTVTEEDMHERLLEQGYHITMVSGFLYQEMGPHTALVATKGPQEKTQFKQHEHEEFCKLISSCHLPYVYFDEPDGPWTKYFSSSSENKSSWLRRNVVPMHYGPEIVKITAWEENAPANEG
jgi:hypothetical protein